MRTSHRTTLLALLAVASASAFAGPFTAGNIVVYRTGDGTLTQDGTAHPVFIDEYTPAGVLVQSVAIPTVANGNNRQYTDTGNGTTSGMLNRSVDKQYLTSAGYDALLGTAGVTATASATVNRVVARVKFDGTVDTTTAFDAYSGNTIRSAVSVDGTGFWTAGTGTNSGVRYIPYGVGQTSVQLVASPTNTRDVTIFNGQLYVGAQTQTFRGVSMVGSGLPTTAGQTLTLLPGFDPDPNSLENVYQYQFADANTLYVADQSTLAGGFGGLQKWTFDSGTGTWSKAYTITAGVPGPNGLLGVVVVPNVNGNIVYATCAPSTGGAGPTGMFTLVDTGPLSSFSTFGPAVDPNKFYHGMSLAPEGAAVPVTLTPNSISIGLGNLISGTAADLGASGGGVVKLCKGFVPNFASPRMRMDATYLSPYLTATSVQLDMNARMTTGGAFKIRGFLADTSGSGTFTYGVANQVIADTAIALAFAPYSSGAVAVGTHIDTDADATADGTIVARTEIQQTGFSAVPVPCSEWDAMTVTVTP